MNWVLIIFGFLISTPLWATPEKIEIFFLSEQKVQTLIERIEKKDSPQYSKALVQNYECIPMGEGCFHPQLGFTKEKPPVLSEIEEEARPEGYKLNTINSLDVQMIECREGEYFDIFCGQSTLEENKKEKPADLEVWFDISTSMRKTDYSKDLEHCNRRTMARVLKDRCEQSPRIAVYNTSLKALSDLSGICLFQGTNDQNRLLQWIRASKAKHLVLVMDTEEYSGELRDFLALENAVVHGLETESLYSDNLVDRVDKLTSSCKK
jgi:hypothetical protein